MIFIGNLIEPEHLKLHLDGFRSHLRRLFYRAAPKYRLQPKYTFEKKFYRSLLIDRNFCEALINITPEQLIAFEDLAIYKKNRLFFLLCLDKKTRSTLPFSANFNSELKNLPKEIRGVNLDSLSEEVRKRCEKVFNFKKFSRVTLARSYDESEWNAYNFVKKVSSNSCPYCNLDLTTTIIECEKVTKQNRRIYVMRPALDHFLAKSLYPFFAVSPYNLVPSCNVCNSTLKQNKDFKKPAHLSPYQAGFEEKSKFRIKFSVCQRDMEIINNIYTFGKIDVGDIEIVVESNNSSCKNNTTNFKIVQRYNTHKRNIKNFLNKLPQVHSKRLEDYKSFSSNNNTLESICEFIDHEEDRSEFKNIPWSQFKHDLLLEHSDLYAKHFTENN